MKPDAPRRPGPRVDRRRARAARRSRSVAIADRHRADPDEGLVRNLDDLERTLIAASRRLERLRARPGTDDSGIAGGAPVGSAAC